MKDDIEWPSDIPKWKHVWRAGLAPIIGTESLKALLVAARTDDKHLAQGSTTTPPPLMCVQDWPVEAACALGFCGAVENGGFSHTSPNPATVGQCEERFAELCFNADQRLGAPAAVRMFLNWFDDTARDVMLRELASELEAIISEREHGEGQTT